MTRKTGKFKKPVKFRPLPKNKQSRAYRRRINSFSLQNKMLSVLSEVSASLAKDRPNYLNLFYEVWQTAAKNVSAVADAVFETPHVELSKESWEQLFEPYDILHLLMFSRLMDHLACEEEEHLTALADELDRAWQKLFAAVGARNADHAQKLHELEDLRKRVQDRVIALFKGEAELVLRADLSNDIARLTEAHAYMAERMLK